MALGAFALDEKIGNDSKTDEAQNDNVNLFHCYLFYLP
jgi:hypothetical protein